MYLFLREENNVVCQSIEERQANRFVLFSLKALTSRFTDTDTDTDTDKDICFYMWTYFLFIYKNVYARMCVYVYSDIYLSPYSID